MALKRGLLLLSGVAACNSIFGIEEGAPRRAKGAGGEPTMSGGTGNESAGAVGHGGHAGGSETEGGRAGEGGEIVFAGNAGAGGSGDECLHARWPARPKPVNANALPEIVLAARSLDIERTEVVGRDLDNTCTCPAPSTCVAPGTADLVCDAVDGRDIGGNQALTAITEAGISAFSEDELEKEMLAGRSGLILRIRGYNGLESDDRVGVEVFGKVWTKGVSPQHAGQDVWTPYADSMQSGVAVDWAMDGYVSGFALVAALPHLTLAFRPKLGENDNPFVVELDEAVLSGGLEQGASGWQLKDGVIAGRWPTERVLRAFGVFEYPFVGGFMCEEGNFAFPQVKEGVCKYADIMGRASLDHQGRACDSISLALGFDAAPALLGGELETPPLVIAPCLEGWQPSCFD